MFKCFISEHDNDCKDCLRVINRVDNDEKWFWFAVEFNNEFINQSIVERDLVDVQLLEELSDEIFILIVFELNDELFQTTFKSLTRFHLRFRFAKRFLKSSRFFFVWFVGQELNLSHTKHFFEARIENLSRDRKLMKNLRLLRLLSNSRWYCLSIKFWSWVWSQSIVSMI